MKLLVVMDARTIQRPNEPSFNSITFGVVDVPDDVTPKVVDIIYTNDLHVESVKGMLAASNAKVFLREGVPT